MRYSIAVIVIVIGTILAVFAMLQASSGISLINLLNLMRSPEPGLCVPGETATCEADKGFAGFRACENGRFSEKCYLASLDDCGIGAEQVSAICCMSESGSIYDCSAKEFFSAGEYVITKVNFKKALEVANAGFVYYRSCGFSRLVKADSQVPEHYKPNTELYDEQRGVICSPVFYYEDFGQGAADGFVPDSQGIMQIVEWRAYPAGTDLSSAQAALDHYNESLPIFSFEVNVGG